jgi:hypothetical protein
MADDGDDDGDSVEPRVPAEAEILDEGTSMHQKRFVSEIVVANADIMPWKRAMYDHQALAYKLHSKDDDQTALGVHIYKRVGMWEAKCDSELLLDLSIAVPELRSKWQAAVDRHKPPYQLSDLRGVHYHCDPRNIYLEGVSVNDKGRVEGISLIGKALRGGLPGSFGALECLRIPELSAGDLDGDLTGSVAKLIAQMRAEHSQYAVDLSNNRGSALPAEVGQQLEQHGGDELCLLDLSNRSITGDPPLPPVPTALRFRALGPSSAGFGVC